MAEDDKMQGEGHYDGPEYLRNMVASAKAAVTANYLQHLNRCETNQETVTVAYAMTFQTLISLAGILAKHGNPKQDMEHCLELLSKTVAEIPSTETPAQLDS
jgi:hypothetical protein